MLYQHYCYKASKLIQGSYAAQKKITSINWGGGKKITRNPKKWGDKTFVGVPESINKTNPFLKVEKKNHKNEKDENPQDKNARNHGW